MSKKDSFYNRDLDFTTNSPSYYEALARFNESLRNLTVRMNDVEQRFKDLVLEWLEDGTLAGLLEQVLLDDYATKVYVDKAISDLNINDYATISWVEEQLNEYINMTKNLIKDINKRVDDFENNVNDRISQLIKDINESLKNHKKDILNKVQVKSDGVIYQTYLTELFTGMGAGEIFENASHAPQGMTYVRHNNEDKIFIRTRVEGDSWQANEYSRIIEYRLREDGEVSHHVSYSQPLQIGHQGLSAYVDDDNNLYLYAGATTGNSPNSTKGFSKVEWKGYDTYQSDVTSYQVLGDVNTDHNLKDFHNATPCVSDDGQYIIMAVATTYEANTRYSIIFDRKEVENATDPLCITPLNLFRIDSPPQIEGHILQDLTTDGTRIYYFTGYTKRDGINAITIHSMNGRKLGYYSVEGAYGDYTLDQLKNGDGILGKIEAIEAEGITIKDNELLILTNDVWEKDGLVTKKTQKVHSLGYDKKERSQPINRGFMEIESPASLHLRGTTRDLSIPEGDALQISYWDDKKRTFKNMLEFTNQQNFKMFDARDGSDNEKYSLIGSFFDKGEQGDFVIFRANQSNDYGAGFNAHTSDSNQPGRFSIHFGQGTSKGEHRIYFYVTEEDNPRISPREDDTIDIGSPSQRFRNIYATDGQVKTSDRNHKTEIKDIDDKVLDAWKDVNYIQYKMKDSVKEKGEKARNHIGVIAQQIIEVFKDHGLNAFDYGIVGYDEWKHQPKQEVFIPDEYDENGNLIKKGYKEEIREEIKLGHIYTIRADECLFLEAALMRREIQKFINGGGSND